MHQDMLWVNQLEISCAEKEPEVLVDTRTNTRHHARLRQRPWTASSRLREGILSHLSCTGEVTEQQIQFWAPPYERDLEPWGKSPVKKC